VIAKAATEAIKNILVMGKFPAVGARESNRANCQKPHDYNMNALG
jgi:hypothetical protein